MRKPSCLVALCALLLVAFGPVASADLLAAYDLVGEDPAGDAKNMIVPGNDATPTTLSRGKQDILSLEMANAGDVVHFKMNMAALYRGTSSLLFVVHFKVEGKAYLVCWNIQSAGTTDNSNDVAEEMSSLACSRFTGSETRVGPTTRANGIQVASVDGKIFVRWEVPKSSIGNVESAGITDIVAETWNRGGNVDSAPATSPQSAYMWNRADRAPNEGTWAYSLAPPAPSASVNLTVDPTNATVGPGSSVDLNVTASLVGNATVGYNLTADGLPEGWNATFAAPNGTLTPEANASSTLLTVTVPGDAQNQSVAFNVSLVTDLNITVSYAVNITVDTTLAAPEPGPAASPGATETAGNETGAAQATEEGSGVPGPAVPLVGAAIAAALVWRSRRRT